MPGGEKAHKNPKSPTTMGLRHKDLHTSGKRGFVTDSGKFVGRTEGAKIANKAPQWGQKRPVLSAPVDRLSGSFNGVSQVSPLISK